MTKIRLSVKVERDTKKRLEEMAKKKGVTISEIIVD